MSQYKALANTGASVVLLHHTGKGENTKQYRGSSDIKAVVDQAFCLERLGDATGSRELRLTPFKCRMAEVEPVKLNFSGGCFDRSIADVKTNREMLEDIIRQHPNSNGKAIKNLAMSAGIAKNTVDSLLTEGRQDGWLVATRGERNSYLYGLRVPDA